MATVVVALSVTLWQSNCIVCVGFGKGFYGPEKREEGPVFPDRDDSTYHIEVLYYIEFLHSKRPDVARHVFS